MVQKIFLGSALSVFLIFSFVLRPVPIVTEDRALVKSGTVTEIYEIGELDVVFKLAETDQRFYINRGLERGLEGTVGTRQAVFAQRRSDAHAHAAG